MKAENKYKAFRTSVADYVKWVTTASKEAAKQSKAKSKAAMSKGNVASVEEEDLIDLCETMKKEAGNEPWSKVRSCAWTAADFEKGGKAFAAPAARNIDTADEIRNMQYYKDQCKWVLESMEARSLYTAAARIVKPPVLSKISGLLNKSVDQGFQPITASEKAIEDIAEVAFFQSDSDG